jgi:hypothetical protein
MARWEVTVSRNRSLARLRHPVGAALLGLVGLALLGPAPAAAKSLDELRKDGTVGERFDGYAVARAGNPSEEVAELLQGINDKRRAIYQKRAEQEGVPVEQVGRVYAKKIFEEAPAGTWFLDDKGKWLQKE